MNDHTLAGRLLGRWALVEFAEIDPAGARQHVLGSDATGFIVYGDDGWVSVQMMASGRAAFDGTSVDGATQEQAAAAATSYLAYAGRYTVDEDTRMVVHHVAVSLQPNWVGHAMPRYVRFEGKRGLVLTAPMSPTTGKTTVITWRRPDGI